MTALILSLIKSLQLYLELKNRSFFYDIREKSKKRQTEIINEIEKLRSIGDANSTYRADSLRSELQSERDEIEFISATYLKTKGE